MGLIELFMVAIGLSMDAFAVSLCKGLCMKKINYRHAVIIAAFFGGFQALMPLLGWLLGHQFDQYITKYDHWVAFTLLSFIGGKMLVEAFKQDEECPKCTMLLDLKELVILAIATSIDALAVGITFAFLRVIILPAIAIIGFITFAICFAGVVVGNRFGVKYKSKAEIAGGFVLIFIGIKILIEHLSAQ
ncbi:MAG TPA: manganese efflux pump [Clostridiaceae bacterium]|nr:manganese efflux pump [Clostridiaceae bacterium]